MDVIHIFIILSYSRSTGLTLIYRIHHNKKEGGLQEAEGLLAVVDVALLHHHEQLPLDQHHQEDEVQRRVQHHLVQNE